MCERDEGVDFRLSHLLIFGLDNFKDNKNYLDQNHNMGDFLSFLKVFMYSFNLFHFFIQSQIGIILKTKYMFKLIL